MNNKFEFYAYNPPTSGQYNINGFIYRGEEDFRNEKRYKEYLDCGFTMLQVRYENAYNGEEWETSNTKLVCDKAYKAGVRKLLITDLRIDSLITPEDPVGEGKRFSTEAELDEQLKEWIATYKDVPGFYGIQLKDEPKYPQLKAYGRVARSLKRIMPSIYLQCNLNPMPVPVAGIENMYEAYEEYIRTYFNETEQSHISMDDYPFRREYIINGNTLRGYAIIAKVCKEMGKEFHTVLQSMAWVKEGRVVCRPVNKSDLYWQMNLAMGFAVKQFSFYTYMPKSYFYYDRGSGDGVNGACFINNDGSRAALYGYAKRMMSEMQQFAEVVLPYNYENAYIITEQGKTKADFEWTAPAPLSEEHPFPITVDKGVAFVSELKNGENRLYMIENIGNIRDELFDKIPPMKVEFSLPNKNVKFYFKGKQTNCKEKDGIFFRKLKVGEALFIEIKK
jgi:hypothetical protein